MLDFYINLNIRFKNYFDNSMEEFNMSSQEDKKFRDRIAGLNSVGPDTADMLMENYSTRKGLALAEPGHLVALFGMKPDVAQALIIMAKAGLVENHSTETVTTVTVSTKAFKKRNVKEIPLTGGHKVEFTCSLCGFDLSAFVLKASNGLTVESLRFCPNSACKKTLHDEEFGYCYACSGSLTVGSTMCVQCSADSTDQFDKQVLVVYQRMEKGLTGIDALMVVENMNFKSSTCQSIINNKKYSDALRTVMSGGALPVMGGSFRE